MREIKQVLYGTNDYNEVVKLRDTILRKPLHLQFTTADLAIDQDEIILAIFENESAIACLQLRPLDKKNIKLRQMAISTSFQKQGLGQKLIKFAEQTALENSFTKISLHARQSALKFYQKLDYQSRGNVFTEVGIPHVFMYKNLTPLKQ